MNISRLISSAICLLATVTALHAQREVTSLPDSWKFIKQDVPLTAKTEGWESVTLPHTWNALDGQLGKARNPHDPDGYYRGACWYARTLDIPADWKGRKRVFLRCEAAALVSKVYLNGSLLGEHRGGFTAFCYELTPQLHFGAANELRVRVDNSHQNDVPPLSGDFNIDGGLYRPVHLIVTDTICITPLDYATPGVYVTTKSLDAEKASVEVKSLLSNGGESSAKVGVEVEIKDASGKPVAENSRDETLSPGQTTPVALNLVLDKPHFWQGRDDPYLYSVSVRVTHEGTVVDEVLQPLGLRTLAITQEQGFVLNGRPYPIHGVNLHQDTFNKGWALSPADHEEDARIIEDMGVTAIRLAHYPQSENLHDLCDRSGLLLWNEVSLVNGISDAPEFTANATQQLREMILQRYNHPSAAFWGTFNEMENQKTPPPDELLRRLKALIHEMDPTRIDVGASNHYLRAYNKIPTAIGFNAYPGWYGDGTPDELAKIIDDHAQEIGGRIAISEYGGGANPAQHQEGSPRKIDQSKQFHPEEWQSHLHEREWAVIKDNPKLWGSFVWVMFDFPSAGRHEGGSEGINDKGLVTQDRKVKKDAYFFYKANWNPTPMVSIASSLSTPRKEAITEIRAYSNCPEVELLVNGTTLGVGKPDELKIVRWEGVTLRPGKNKIEVTGRSGAQTVSDTCVWEL
jgi:beta-galactosidase